MLYYVQDLAISPRRRSALTLEVSLCFCLLVVAGKFADVEKSAVFSFSSTWGAPAGSWVAHATAMIAWRQHYEEWQALLDTTCKAEKELGRSSWQVQHRQQNVATNSLQRT